MKIQLNNDLKITNNYMEKLLNSRGITNIEKFINPTKECVNPTSNLGNVPEGVNMLVKHMKKTKEQNILVIVDSDVDGYCSATVIWQFLKENYNKEIDYICHDAKQHGLADIVKRINIDAYDLVILPDAGTNDDSYILDYPNTDFLILDHHERTGEPLFPENAVVVNNQLSKNYTNKALSGAGITWQFCREVAKKEFNKDLLEEGTYLDLVAVALISDMMDVTTLENRYFIKYGLNQIENYFLQALIEKNAFSIGVEVTPIKVAFYMAPMINSMCRVGTLEEKERMFLAFIDGERLVPSNKRGAKETMEKVAIESARECTNTKSKQKRISEKIQETADIEIGKNGLLDNKILIIKLNENFEDIPSEMNGITAMKISQQYNRPTIVARVNDEGMLKGSARGLATIDMPGLREFFLSSQMFEYAEGHSLAHGISIRDNLVDKFLDWSNEQLKDVDFNQGYWSVDFIREPHEAEDIKDIVFDLDKIQDTFGQQNPEPLIYIKNILVKKEEIQVIGKKLDTVKIIKEDVTYMFFKRTPEQVQELLAYDELLLSVVGSMNVNRYNGYENAQIFVKEYDTADGRLSF